MKTYFVSLLIVVLLIAILAAILQPGIWTALNAVGTAVLFAGGILICKYYRFYTHPRITAYTRALCKNRIFSGSNADDVVSD